MRLSIVIPTYNESDNLTPLVARIAQALVGKTDDYEVFFVDDSADETPKLLARMSESDPHIRYIHREEKTGLASAVVCGFDNARGDVIAVMDADLQHPPELLPEMLAGIDEGADVVLPSRYVGTGESEGLSPIRTLASKSAKYAAKVFLPSMKNVSDPMSGFFMFRREVIEGARLNPIGWKILMEVLVMGKYTRVVEIPYGFEKRNAGESKLSLKVTVEYFLHILSLASRGARERQRYALVLSCLLGILVDIAAYAVLWALWALPPRLSAGISVFVAGLALCLCHCGIMEKNDAGQKKQTTAVACALLLVVLVAVKTALVFLLSITGLTAVYVNLWSAILTMLLYGLFIHKRLFTKPGGQATYTVRARGKE